jgi:amino acid transporter
LCGFGQSSRLQHAVYRDIKGVVLPAEPEGHDTHVMLGTFRATAICGNDITGSCLYTAGLCVATVCGSFCILLRIASGGIPFPLRAGGSNGPHLLGDHRHYPVRFSVDLRRSCDGDARQWRLLQCITEHNDKAHCGHGCVFVVPVLFGHVCLCSWGRTSVSPASSPAVLSPSLRCVVSASSAVLYAQNFWAELPFKGPTVIVLAIFALLCAWGLKDSANVALAMFLLHILTMSILVVAGIVFIIRDDGRILRDNWHMPWPHILDNTTVVFRGTWFHALFFGVARGLLGITGFETSSNFVEEQLPGVFQKTLYWMWLAVTFFNPVLALLALGTCTWHELTQHQNDLLAFMGGRAINHGFRVFVAVDATIVLAGSVLTSYVGVTGLLRRMALDRCLPQWFLHCNKWRNTNQNIIFTFFVVSTSLFLALNGNIQTLSGVYTMAFLSVMVCVCCDVNRVYSSLAVMRVTSIFSSDAVCHRLHPFENETKQVKTGCARVVRPHHCRHCVGCLGTVG